MSSTQPTHGLLVLLCVGLVAVALFGTAATVYMATNPRLITQTQYMTQTQMQTNSYTQTSVSTNSVTIFVLSTVTTTSSLAYGPYNPNGQQIQVFGYLAPNQSGQCVYLTNTNTGSVYSLYNLPTSYPTGGVVIWGYINYYGYYNNYCSGQTLYVISISQ